MNNSAIILGACEQLKLALERIESLTSEMDRAKEAGDNEELPVFEEMRIQELDHTQLLTLLLTKKIVAESESGERSDSAFFSGELTDTLGEKEGTESEDEGDDEQQ